MRRRSFLALTASLALLPLRGPALAAQTPATVSDGGGLMALLRLLPDDALGDTGVRYASYRAQLAALGVEETGADLAPERWQAAMGGAAMIPGAFTVPLDPVVRQALGFDLRDVDAMLEAGPADVSILILAGRFDAASLPAAWEAAGYSATDTGGVTWYTLGEDNVLTFDDPFHMTHLGALSHLALLDDGTVAGTAKRADMERVLALHGGSGTSLAAGRAAALAGAPADLAAGWIVDGATLVPVGDPLAAMPNNPNVPADVQERLATQAAETAAEAPRMPPIALALLGATAGLVQADSAMFPDAPRGHAVAVVVPQSEADAAMVAETVTRRLTTLLLPPSEPHGGMPYADAFPVMVVETTPEGAVAVDLTPAEDVSATLLIRLLQARQLLLLAWGA